MQVNRNGIPLDIPGQQTKMGKIMTTKNLHNEFNKFNKFATMVGFEDGCHVTAVVPMGHPDFKAMLSQGYKVIDIWDKRNVREEIA